MSDRYGEMLSAWVDGELGSGEVDALLLQLKRDPELRQRWNSYHLIGDAISGHPVSIHGDMLSQRVAEALVDEPTTLAPQRRSVVSRLVKPLAGLAVAASVTAIAVLSLQLNYQNGIGSGNQLVAQAVPAPAPVEYRRLAANVDASKLKRELNRYLVEHSDTLSGSRVQGMSPIRRIAAERVGYR